MNLPDGMFESQSSKVRKLLNESIELERRRRQLALEASELITKISDLNVGLDRTLVQGWINELMEDLR
jgi:hypothetical protein